VRRPFDALRHIADGSFGPVAPALTGGCSNAVEVDRNGLEVLTRDECLRLLGNAMLGRVAVSTEALPTILPVSFAFDGKQILVRTGRGTKLDAATHNQVVAFEVDEVSPLTQTGWSVVVTGIARELTAADELADARRRPLVRWVPGEDSRVIAISTEVVSGRRIVPRREPRVDSAG
jgi:nitroimidazol reductase NimA-like FMN-containing flavoprotein (pyridoxamine 5'-phosphate oxidase superfamily)